MSARLCSSRQRFHIAKNGANVADDTYWLKVDATLVKWRKTCITELQLTEWVPSYDISI
jgi:hypothetical protein